MFLQSLQETVLAWQSEVGGYTDLAFAIYRKTGSRLTDVALRRWATCSDENRFIRVPNSLGIFARFLDKSESELVAELEAGRPAYPPGWGEKRVEGGFARADLKRIVDALSREELATLNFLIAERLPRSRGAIAQLIIDKMAAIGLNVLDSNGHLVEGSLEIFFSTMGAKRENDRANIRALLLGDRKTAPNDMLGFIAIALYRLTSDEAITASYLERLNVEPPDTATEFLNDLASKSVATPPRSCV